MKLLTALTAILSMTLLASAAHGGQILLSQAVADGVNVNYDVYRIGTQVTEEGGRVDAGYYVDLRDRETLAEAGARSFRIGDLMQTNVIEVLATEDQEEAAGRDLPDLLDHRQV